MVGKPNLPTPNGCEINSSTKVGSEFDRDFTAPKLSVNRHGQLTNGKYTIDSKGMDPHISGKTSTGKSQFLYGIDAEKAVLDAAAYADKFNLWKGNKARVPVMNGPVGVHGGTGELTYYINIYRTNTGYVHGAPAGPVK